LCGLYIIVYDSSGDNSCIEFVVKTYIHYRRRTLKNLRGLKCSQPQ